MTCPRCGGPLYLFRFSFTGTPIAVWVCRLCHWKDER